MSRRPIRTPEVRRPSDPAVLTRGAGLGWLRSGRFGLFFAAVVVGVGAGVGAVVFRYLVLGATWLVTGSTEFGDLGRVGSSHLPALGFWFIGLAPVVGGLVYGPLIRRFAPEARGHGVPEVMVAVARNGGRIRPQVSVVKALASALCIATGGSVGREGPIVQIGSALASGLGQWVRMPENRLRVLVACGAAGGISATFNAPITGVFFAAELILREISGEAVFAIMLASMLADVIGRTFFGAAPFFAHLPAGIELRHTLDYLLVAGLAVVAALIGLLFKTVLYTTEDLCDRVWGNRPEWARPAVGGVLLGGLLLALPQLYGVGYPVLYRTVDGDYLAWFLILLAAGKIIATSLTIGIGGSGGVFAPSLFVGATSGMAFGQIAVHLLGPVAGQPALYAVVGMAAVFASAARGPLTALASVVEMTGHFALTLPVMLAVAVATSVSKALSHGTIYTTKLLRRSIDLDQPDAGHALTGLTVADAMHRFTTALPVDGTRPPARSDHTDHVIPIGALTRIRRPQTLFGNENLAQALRQLILYGRDGLPVLSTDGRHLEGWITNQLVLRTVADQLASTARDHRDHHDEDHSPGAELPGYELAEYTIGPRTAGRRAHDLTWPPGHLPVSILHNRRLREPTLTARLKPGDRINVLVPTPDQRRAHEPAETA